MVSHLIFKLWLHRDDHSVSHTLSTVSDVEDQQVAQWSHGMGHLKLKGGSATLAVRFTIR